MRGGSFDRYGWVVVLCAFTLMFTGFGAAYSFAAFFSAFQAEFGAPRAHVALVFSLCALLWFSIGVPGGMLADRFGPRGVCLAGASCLAAGLALAAHAQSVEVLYVTYSVGVGVGIGLSYVPSVGAVQRWFVRNRAFASGIAVSGIGAGNLAFPPLAAWWIDLYGWRGAYLALAGLSVALAIPAALAVDNGKSQRSAAQSAAPTAGVSLGAALRAPRFWTLYAIGFLVCVGFFVPMVHLVPYAHDAGYSEAQGVALVSLLGLGSLLGRFVIGAVADRLGHLRALVALAAGLGAMFLLWWIADSYQELEMARLLTYRLACKIDRGATDFRRDAAMAKVQATEMVQRVVDRAMQVHGGMGMTKALPLEYMSRVVRVYRVVEGPSEVHRWTLARALLKNGLPSDC